MTRKYLAIAGLIVGSFLATSCGSDATAPGAAGSTFSSTTQSGLAAADDAKGPNSHALDAQLRQEQHRIELEARRSRQDYERLKHEWDAWLHNNKKLKRNEVAFPTCEPQPYVGETKVIGPEGGELKIGPHTLRIPAGALTEPTVVTGESPVSNLVTVTFSPHGLTFLKQPTLSLSYAHCFLPQDFRYRLAYVDDDNNLIEYPLSEDRKGKDKVVGRIWHFSKYAIAY
jgi:hypothetical protein